MEEKDRQRMEKEYNRLEQWIVKLERMKNPENMESIFFRPEEALHLLFSPPVSAAALPWQLPFRPCPWYVPAPVFYSLLTSHLLFSLF